jgi:phospho-N-acetylmuramoyl-pentapeptide-transferase
MIYRLVQNHQAWLNEHGLGFLRVFNAVTFQSTAAVVCSFVIVLALGPRVIDWLRRQKIGDNPDFDQAQLNELMKSKKGTPTMGGILIIGSIAATTLLLADLSNFYVRMALICLIWLGGIGAVDDWLKLTAAHRGSGRQGLHSHEKLLFQLGLSVVLGYFTYNYGGGYEATKQFFVPFLKNYHPAIPLSLYILIAALVMTGSSNAVNLTDGLDGLASGCMALVGFTFLVLAILVGTSALAGYLQLPNIPEAGQMAVFAGAILGSCLGFLWYNCNPARVFMGDTGSLALGGLIGYIAIVVRHELTLVIAGGIFVLEAVSVLLQVSYFKYTRKRYGEGRRIFLMAPAHHHFQRKGWTETQVVVRFWLIGAMLAAMALATVKLR